ncbi:MAG: hypothetical protein GY756_11720, partial [bacterium]|nr:hypothetical protein [bacterium]
MKRIITLAIPLLFVSYAFSQPWLKNLPQTKSKSELSLYDYRKAFNEYWKPYNIDNGYYIKDGVKTKAFGWKQFKRWEWNWESQVDLKTGKFPTKEQFDALKTNRNPVTKSGNKGADWQSEGPNYVTDPGFWGIGRINCITFHPTDNNIYWVGAASGGLWVTTDNGNNWTCHTDDNAVLAVSDIAIPSDYSSSNTIYIATGDRDSWDYRSVGVLKSTDGGITWNTTDLSFSFADEDMVSRLLIDPKDDQTIIASTYKGGVLKTTDGGTNWSTQLSTRYFIDMEHKPGDFNTLYGSTKTGGEIHVSNDGGKTWNTSINTEGDRIEIAVSSDEPTWVYAIVSGNNGGLFGIYKSEDSGNNFNQILDGTASGNNLLGRSINGTSSGGQGSYDLSIAVSPNDANTIIIGGIMSHISYNGGVSWSCSSYYRPLTNNSGEYPIVHADKHMHKYRKDGALFETNDGGIYVSTDNGKSWSHKTNTMVISEMYRLGVSASNEGEVITGLQDNSSKLLHNRGIWKNVLGGDGMECIIDYTNSKVQ